MTIAELRRADNQGMYDIVRDFPAQWREGRRLALEADLGGLDLGDVRQVLVAGMGGSAIGGELLRVLAAPVAPLPVTVARGYRLPAWVGPQTLVIASSYSGNTEETLAMLGEAEARGAAIVGVATGGTLAERLGAAGHPLLTLPGGLMPRAALGYSLTALLTLAERLGLLHLGAASWDEAEALLATMSESLAVASDNRALTLARQLEGRLPFVYRSDGLAEAAGLRWINQLQENAKVLAFGNVFPELNHNEITGWEVPAPWHARCAIVVLRDRDDPPRTQRRIAVTRMLLEPRAGAWIEVESRGTSALARVLSLVYLGDWVSLYLAALRGVDPTPIVLIDRLKNALAAGD